MTIGPTEEHAAVIAAEHRRRWVEATVGPRPSAARAVVAGVLATLLALGGVAAVEVLAADAPARPADEAGR